MAPSSSIRRPADAGELHPRRGRDRQPAGVRRRTGADDAQGNLVGPGDLAAQARQAFANVGRSLAAAGAEPEQVAKLTIYVVQHRPEYLPDISEARMAVFGNHKPADTLVGVETLAEPGYLIEVEAIAVVD